MQRTSKAKNFSTRVRSAALFTSAPGFVPYLIRLHPIFETRWETAAMDPTTCADGATVRDRMVVSFRSLGGRQSCVVFGPCGLPEVVE
jgi:hypothetical protein